MPKASVETNVNSKGMRIAMSPSLRVYPAVKPGVGTIKARARGNP
jgi:hypothetical protein